MKNFFQIINEIYNERNWRGDCYNVVGDVMMQCKLKGVNDAYAVHGYPINQGKLKGQRYAHAWLERKIDGQVFCYDLTIQEDPYHKDLYYKLGNIDEIHIRRYSVDQACMWMRKTEHYGPWEPELLD